jgi:hypothetical protein
MLVRVLLSVSLICGSITAADSGDDAAIRLARILAGKGTISAADLTAIEAAPLDRRVAELAAVLEKKGVLNRNDVAQLSLPVAPQAVVATGPGTSAQRTAAPPPPSKPEVTTATHTPITFYGTLLLNAVFNTAPNDIEDVPLFLLKPGTGPLGGDRNLAMTARQTRLGLRLSGVEVAGAALSGDFEFDLFGGKTPLTNGMNMDMFRLRLAYGRLEWKRAAFEAGQDWSVFSPLNPTSLAEYAIPALSASGNPWIRLPQIRGEFSNHGFHAPDRLLVQVAAADPNVGDYPTTPFSTSRQPAIGESGRMPALEARVAYTKRVDDRDYTIGLSGTYGHGRNSGLIAGVAEFRGVDSWGVNLDYMLPFTHWFNLSGEAFEGRALGIYSVTAGEPVGAVGTPGEHGVESRGGWSQAQFNFAKQWQVNLAYGLEVPNASELPVGNRWRNQTYMGNLMYKLSPNVTFAWEYRRLLTDFRNQAFANARGDHVNLAIAYIF